MLKIKNISTGYNKKQVLFDVSFQINESEIVLLIGSNGSGKSTLLKAVYGLLPIYQNSIGEIIFDNNRISDTLTADLIKNGLMYLPQKNICFDNLTVKENMEISGLSLKSSKLLAERVQNAFDLFPILHALQRRKAISLSGGERQLLALSMASLHKPKLIMLDEPLTGLSDRNIKLVKHFITQLNVSEKTAFLIVEHRIREIAEIGNRLIGLKLGRVFGEYQLNGNLSQTIIREILI